MGFYTHQDKSDLGIAFTVV